MTAGDLDGNVAVVTGGSSGIGKAIALRLAAEGSNVLITGRTQQRLDATANEHPNIEAIAADVTVPEDVPRTVERATELWGGIDILVNNAGPGFDRPSPVGEQSWEYVEEVFTTNVIGPTILVEEALSTLEDGGGTIVNITSSNVQHLDHGMSSYGGAKAALAQLTRYWATELAPKVRVNAVAPGPVDTPVLDRRLPEEQAEQYKAQQRETVLLDRRGEPEEIAHWVSQLVNPGSSWVTGEVFFVDGGHSIV